MEIKRAAIALNVMEQRPDSVSLLQLRLCCQLQSLPKLCHCNAPFTKRLHKDVEAQWRSTNDVYGEVHTTTAVPVEMTIITRMMMKQKQLCPPTSAMKLDYISSITLELKWTKGSVLNQSVFTISPKMETDFQAPMPQEASLGISQIDCDVVNIWLSNTLPASMNNSAARLCLNAQVRKEYNQAKRLSEKASVYNDETGMSLHLSPPTTLQIFLRIIHWQTTLCLQNL